MIDFEKYALKVNAFLVANKLWRSPVSRWVNYAPEDVLPRVDPRTLLNSAPPSREDVFRDAVLAYLFGYKTVDAAILRELVGEYARAKEACEVKFLRALGVSV